MSEALLWNELGNIYIKIGSPEDAIGAYTKAIELNPDSGWPYCNLGHAYYLIGEYSNALILFRKSIQLMDTHENQAAIWNKIGDAYRALKEINKAVQAYKKADDLMMVAAPSDQVAAPQSGNLVSIQVNVDTNRNTPDVINFPPTLSKKATRNDPSTKGHSNADGIQPMELGKVSGEIKTPLDRLELLSPVSPQQNRKKDQDITASTISTSQNMTRPVRDGENSPGSREKTLIVIPNSNEMDEKLPAEMLTRSEPDKPNTSSATDEQIDIRDGKSKSQTKTHPVVEDLEELLAKVNIYENITRVSPTNDRAWDTLGKLYKSLSRYKDAINAYQKAIEIAPDREVYYYYLGLLFSVEQQHEAAVQAFEFVLRKNPDYVLAHSALAGIYHRMGLENKANHHITIALPKMNDESAYNRACFYVICGDNELAFEFLRLALKNKDTTIEWIKSDPDLDPIRSDSRYQALISEKDLAASEKNNYFASEMKGKQNRLLPILNNSLER